MRPRGFIVARPAERVQPESGNLPAHDAINRLLHRMEPSPEALWQEGQKDVSEDSGILVIDDSTLDKFYAFEDGIGDTLLVRQTWTSGARHQSDYVTWTEGDRHIPLDYRFYEKSVDGATKNDHFRALLETALERGFKPECVVFDSWYSSLEISSKVRFRLELPHP